DPIVGVPGSGGDGYTFMATTSRGTPVTWPCDGTIELEVNPQGAPEGYAELVDSAMGQVNDASGWVVEVVGETDDRRYEECGAGPVLLMWADEEEVPELAGRTAGIGGSSYLQGPGGGGRSVGGMVVIDTDMPGGFWRRT